MNQASSIQTVQNTSSNTGDRYYTGDWDIYPPQNPFSPYEPSYPGIQPGILPYVPNPTIIPIPQKVFVVGPGSYEYTPNDWWDVHIPSPLALTVDSSEQWRVSYDDDRVTAAIDMAGVRPEDINVEVREGHIIHVEGKRFDTKRVVTRTYTLGPLYDAKTAAATIEAGVLTIIVLRAKTSNAHKVTVTVK